MTTFAYKSARLPEGLRQPGRSRATARPPSPPTLRSKGFTVLDLNEVKTGLGADGLGAAFQTIKSKDLTVFSRQFATMVNSGLSMLRCLYVLEEQTPNKKLAKVDRRDPRGRRGRHQPVRRAREAPQGVQPALREHGPRRRARRYPRRGAQPPRHASSRKKTASAGAVKSAMVYPMVIGYASPSSC